MAFLDDVSQTGRSIGQGIVDILGAVASPAMPLIETLVRLNNLVDPRYQQAQQQAQQKAFQQQREARIEKQGEQQLRLQEQALKQREQTRLTTENRAAQVLKRQDEQLAMAKERLQAQKDQFNQGLLQKENILQAAKKLRDAGKFLSPQEFINLDALLQTGNIAGASKYLQSADRYAKIRDLQDQGKLTTADFDEQVAGLYPEITNEKQKEVFIKGARKTFIEDPGWFQTKKLIPQIPRQQVQPGQPGIKRYNPATGKVE